jgi:lipopolysaccharide/colanic/teichoic acid biosynthesis glycosyltransferase
MASEPMKAVELETENSAIAEHFTAATQVIESDRYRSIMQDMDRVEEAVAAHFAKPSVQFQLALKRLIDIVGSFFLIMALAPVLILTAIAVKYTSKGPIMFAHKRWALQQQFFMCLKFRSMYTDQSKIKGLEEVKAMEKSGILLKLKKDPRLTSVGPFIRKTSIDELPQLFNVLKGDMSLVGPRPLVPHMMQPYPKIRRVRCTVRPGITGLWQIRDRANNTSVIAMMPHDLDYLLNYSLLLDVRILLATLPAVLWGTGAV